MNDDELHPRSPGRGEHAADAGRAAPPWRITQELPVTSPRPDAAVAEPGTEPVDPDEPPRRVTQELPAAQPAPIARRVLHILRMPQEWGETAEDASRRRERALAAAFEALDPAEASELFCRLASPRVGDPVAMGFARLPPDRRGRLFARLLGQGERAARWGAS